MRAYRKHRILVLACILFQAGGVGILINSTGLFMTGISQSGLFSTHEISIYLTLRTISSAVFVAPLTRMFYRVGARKHLLWLTGMMALTYLMLASSTSNIMFYISAVVAGLSTATIVIPMPIIVSHWFNERRGLVLGLVFSASGVTSALYNMLLSPMMNQFGWQYSIFISIVIGVVLMLPGALRFINLTPEETGVAPYGKSILYQGQQARNDEMDNAPFSLFTTVAIAVAFCGTLSALVNYIPMYALSKGYDLQIASTLTSLCMVGNVSGKLLLGYFFDKIGAYRTTLITLVILILSILMMLSDSMILMMVGSVIFGFNFGLYLLMPPILILNTFGQKLYKKMIGLITSIASTLIAMYTLSIGFLYRHYGNYEAVMILGAIFCAISFMACLILYVQIKRTASVLEIDSES